MDRPVTQALTGTSSLSPHNNPIKFSHFCHNVCFENTNLFPYDWHMREQCERNASFTFAHVRFCP